MTPPEPTVPDPESWAAQRAQWLLTLAVARAFRGQGPRGGALVVTRELVLAGEMERLRRVAGESGGGA
jgi:hypothetical protein